MKNEWTRKRLLETIIAMPNFKENSVVLIRLAKKNMGTQNQKSDRDTFRIHMYGMEKKY